MKSCLKYSNCLPHTYPPIRMFCISIVVMTSLIISACSRSHSTAFYHEKFPASECAGLQVNEVDVIKRILLIGDAGAADSVDTTLDLLTTWAKRMPKKTTIFFLGDNIYESGLPVPDAEDRVAAERTINTQLEVIKKSKTRGIIVPGNHDWAHSKVGGFDAIQRQDKYVEKELGSDFPEDNFLPKDGYPGPVLLDMPMADPVVRVLVLDTQWWLHPKNDSHPKPDKEQIISDIRNALHPDLPNLLVAHHPLATHGPHGGFFDWQDHVFPLTNWKRKLWVPLPLIGSLYPLFRWHILDWIGLDIKQDISSDIYADMIKDIQNALSSYDGDQPLIYAAGHDHSLQVLTGTGTLDYILVSGLGSKEKQSSVGDGPDTIFAHADSERTGFMALDFMNDGRILLHVIEVGEVNPVFTMPVGKKAPTSGP